MVVVVVAPEDGPGVQMFERKKENTSLLLDRHDPQLPVPAG
jgi:hypothetical protein